jgi:hypothetical protein
MVSESRAVATRVRNEQVGVESVGAHGDFACAPVVERLAPAVHQAGEAAPARQVEPGDVIALVGNAPDPPLHAPWVFAQEALEPGEPTCQGARRIQLGRERREPRKSLGRIAGAGGWRERGPTLVGLFAFGDSALVLQSLGGDRLEGTLPVAKATKPATEPGVVHHPDVQLAPEVRLLGQFSQAVSNPTFRGGGEEGPDSPDRRDIAPGHAPPSGGRNSESLQGAEGEVHVRPGLTGDDGDPVEWDALVSQGANPTGDVLELALGVRGSDETDGRTGRRAGGRGVAG